VADRTRPSVRDYGQSSQHRKCSLRLAAAAEQVVNTRKRVLTWGIRAAGAQEATAARNCRGGGGGGCWVFESMQTVATEARSEFLIGNCFGVEHRDEGSRTRRLATKESGQGVAIFVAGNVNRFHRLDPFTEEGSTRWDTAGSGPATQWRWPRVDSCVGAPPVVKT